MMEIYEKHLIVIWMLLKNIIVELMVLQSVVMDIYILIQEGGGPMPFTDKQQEFFENASHRWNFKTGATQGPGQEKLTEIIFGFQRE